MEAITNLLASILLGMRYGARGVALGTLIGAAVGMLGHIFYNLPRTRREILVSRRRFVLSGVGLPMLATLPLALVAVRTWLTEVPSAVTVGLTFCLTSFLSAALVLYENRWGLQARAAATPSSATK